MVDAAPEKHEVDLAVERQYLEEVSATAPRARPTLRVNRGNPKVDAPGTANP